MNYKTNKWNSYDVVYEDNNESYLSSIETVLNNALYEYPRMLAVRFDLRLPKSYRDDFLDRDLPETYNTKKVISRFIDSLKAKIKHYLRIKNMEWKRNYSCTLRYVWCKEKSHSINSHYHFCVLLNKDVIRTLGEYHHNNSLASMIRTAWVSALSLDEYQVKALIHFPENHSYIVNYKNCEYQTQYDNLFYRLSYLAKNKTKTYSHQYRSFGCSYK